MGVQQVQDVTLIRHAYVRTGSQKRGIGAHLLSHLRELANRPVLIGTWAHAVWAIRFYERHGFQMVDSEEKHRLLKKYWAIPERQIETSVVLADSTWRGTPPWYWWTYGARRNMGRSGRGPPNAGCRLGALKPRPCH